MNDIQKLEDALFKHISKLIDEAHKHVLVKNLTVRHICTHSSMTSH